jgi:hypothetical protein
MGLIVVFRFLMNFDFRILEIICEGEKDKMKTWRSLEVIRVIIFLLR